MLRELISSVFGPKSEPVLSVKEGTSSGAGSYGTYFKIDASKGVKVLRDWPYCSIKDLDFENYRIVNEFDNQRRANQILGKMVPEVYALVPVQMGSHYYVGILMEHVEGVPMAQAMRDADPSATSERMHGIFRHMTDKGVKKSDHHEWNVLVDTEGRDRVIDWGLGAEFDEFMIAELAETKVA